MPPFTPGPSSHVDAEALLAELGWVRELARQLVADGHQADDLVQETLAVALAAPHDGRAARSGAVPLRAWLAGVLRNLARARSRREGHRRARERAASRDERTPSAAELVERAAVQRVLVGELLELEEPQREVLLLRFFQGLSNEEIARRTGVPASTVASRVARGLERLRGRLERRHGGEVRTWLSALLPLQGWAERVPSPGLTLTGAAIAMGLPTKLLLSAGALAGALLIVQSASREPAPSVEGAAPAPREVAAELAPPLDAPVVEGARVGSAPAAEEVPIEAAPEEAEATIAALPTTVRGRVVDLEGAGVPGVELEVRAGWIDGASGHMGDGTHCGTAGPRGDFEVEVPSGPGILRVADERWVTLVGASVLGSDLGEGPHAGPTRPETEHVLVAGWRIPLAGVVVDQDGAPIEGATLHVSPPELSHLRLVLDRGVEIAVKGITDAKGRFDLEGVADLPDGHWFASAPNHEPWVGTLPPGGDRHARIVLARHERDRRRIQGRVLLPDGAPASEALVSIGAVAERTDAEGRFSVPAAGHPALQRLAADVPVTLWAVQEGYRPASLELPALATGTRDGWPGGLVLQLGRADGLVIEGRVVDEEGHPMEGIAVDLLDPTRFGEVAGDGTGTYTFLRNLEELVRGRHAAPRTDAQGRFRLAGLVDRAYRLEALDPDTLLSQHTGPVLAGTRSLEIQLDRRTLGRIAGRLVDAAGEPVSGVRVSVSHVTERAGHYGAKILTDEEGRFELRGAPTAGITLSLVGEGIVPELERPLPEGVDLEALELVAHQRLHVQFEWGALAMDADAQSGSFTEFEVLDAEGQPLTLYVIDGQGWQVRPTTPVFGERSEVFVVPDHAAWARILEGGVEVERVELFLEPGDVNVVEL